MTIEEILGIEEDTITLDVHSLHNLETERGGFTKATIVALGKPWPPIGGWLSSLIGVTIPESQYLEAYHARLITVPKKKKK